MLEGEGLSLRIKQIFWQRFVNVCHQVVIEGYKVMVDNPADYYTWKEENINARLKSEMERLPSLREANISVVREYYLDDDQILAGEKDAQKADRIDFRFLSGWNQMEDPEYFGEAKNLSARTWYKKPETQTGKVNAHKYYNRYITTGIRRIVSGKYSHFNAFLIGYIMNGNSLEIVEKLNQMIQDQELLPEIGRIENRKSICGHPDCYTSDNIRHSIPRRLTHIFLDFAPPSGHFK